METFQINPMYGKRGFLGRNAGNISIFFPLTHPSCEGDGGASFKARLLVEITPPNKWLERRECPFLLFFLPSLSFNTKLHFVMISFYWRRTVAVWQSREEKKNIEVKLHVTSRRVTAARHEMH